MTGRTVIPIGLDCHAPHSSSDVVRHESMVGLAVSGYLR
jgi:hypothetical protein